MRSKTHSYAVVAVAVGLLAALPIEDQDEPGPPSQQSSGGWRRVDEPRQPDRPAAPHSVYSQNLPPQLNLPAGTWITIRMNQEVSSDHNLPGDSFTATLLQPIVANGFVVARRGQTLGGRVAEAEKAGRVKGTSRLGVELTELSLVDGQQLPIRTQLIQYSGGTSAGRDATAIGTTTGVGAAIGAAADGGFGAGMGAIAGAAASTIGVLVTRGRATVLYPEETVTFRTLQPLTISTEQSDQAFQAVNQEDYEPNRLQQRIVRRPPSLYYPGYYAGGSYDPFYSPYFYGPRFYYFSGPRYYGGRRYFRRW